MQRDNASLDVYGADRTLSRRGLGGRAPTFQQPPPPLPRSHRAKQGT